MGREDGMYDDSFYQKIWVKDGGHTVNGIFMDDLYSELLERGESISIF